MDPNELLKAIIEDLDHKDFLSAEDNVDDLLSWLKRGGFSPVGEYVFPPIDAPASLVEKLEKVNDQTVTPS